MAAIIVLIIFVVSGRNNPINTYKKEVWQTSDIIATVVFSLTLLTTLILLFTENMPSFSYSPYPEIAFPPLNWIGVLLSLVPGLPLLIKKHD